MSRDSRRGVAGSRGRGVDEDDGRHHAVTVDVDCRGVAGSRGRGVDEDDGRHHAVTVDVDCGRLSDPATPRPRDPATVIAFLLLCCLFSSCAGQRMTWDRAEAAQVAWWCEDVAHGGLRRPGELALVAGSWRMGRIAEWAKGGELNGRWTPPSPLAARRARLDLLASFLREGTAVLTAEGMLAPRPGLEGALKALAVPAIDAENQDRRRQDSVLVAMAEPDRRERDHYIAEVTRARLELDQALGGKVWAAGPAENQPKTP